jgi:hypothetical protein
MSATLDEPTPRYVVLWIECDDEQDAERIEDLALTMVEKIARGRVVQNRIQEAAP